MLRLLIFIAAVAALAWAGVWMADNPGEVAFSWQGWRVETTAGVAVAAAVVFTAGVAAVYRFWLFVSRAPARLSAALKDRHREKGYRALTQGMVAVAAGDGDAAAKLAIRAEGLLGKPALTLLLKAQAAQLKGDEGAAETFFLAMLENEETAFLGVRGLLGQALKAGDETRALELARRAKALKPKSGWLDDVLFDVESRAGHWQRAGESLARLDKQAPRFAAVDAAAQRRRRAVVAYGCSLEAEAADDRGGSLKWAQKAVNFDPALVPAAIRLAEMAMSQGRSRKARNVVERTWALQPHPDLLTPYFAGMDAVDGLKRVSAAERLAKTNPDHPESDMAIATAALDARLWGQARLHLERAIAGGLATRRAYAAMATLARNETGDGADRAADWLQLAATAPADSAWVCDQCATAQARWTPHCPKCHGFDSQTWRSPPGVLALPRPTGPSGLAGAVSGPSLSNH